MRLILIPNSSKSNSQKRGTTPAIPWSAFRWLWRWLPRISCTRADPFEITCFSWYYMVLLYWYICICILSLFLVHVYRFWKNPYVFLSFLDAFSEATEVKSTFASSSWCSRPLPRDVEERLELSVWNGSELISQLGQSVAYSSWSDQSGILGWNGSEISQGKLLFRLGSKRCTAKIHRSNVSTASEKGSASLVGRLPGATILGLAAVKCPESPGICPKRQLSSSTEVLPWSSKKRRRKLTRLSSGGFFQESFGVVWGSRPKPGTRFPKVPHKGFTLKSSGSPRFHSYKFPDSK